MSLIARFSPSQKALLVVVVVGTIAAVSFAAPNVVTLLATAR